jgi:hypothetical protein
MAATSPSPLKKFKHKPEAELLLAQLCVGISVAKSSTVPILQGSIHLWPLERFAAPKVGAECLNGHARICAESAWQ